MARMPGTTWVGEHGSRKMVRHDIVCVHTIVGKAPAHKAHFSTSADGEIFQSRDTDLQSGANVDGNPRVIAIENEDVGPSYGVWDTDDGHAVPDFTDAQVDAIARICAWASTTHGIPLVPCPDSRPGSRGIAYHRQGINGNFGPFAFSGRVDGGEVWTTSFGKVCPGDRRIRTLLDRIIPRAVAIASGGAVPDLQSAQLDQTAKAEAADMLVGQDATTGEIWVVSGNTKMKLDAGGGTPSGDHHSAGNTGHADVDAMLRMIKDSYPGSDPKFVALSNKLLSRMPEVAQLVDR
jgi:hypothetical protein